MLVVFPRDAARDRDPDFRPLNGRPKPPAAGAGGALAGGGAPCPGCWSGAGKPAGHRGRHVAEEPSAADPSKPRLAADDDVARLLSSSFGKEGMPREDGRLGLLVDVNKALVANASAFAQRHGDEFCDGYLVWAKISGCPWWPASLISLDWLQRRQDQAVLERLLGQYVDGAMLVEFLGTKVEYIMCTAASLRPYAQNRQQLGPKSKPGKTAKLKSLALAVREADAVLEHSNGDSVAPFPQQLRNSTTVPWQPPPRPPTRPADGK